MSEPAPDVEQHARSAPYQLFMVGISLFVLLMLAVRATVRLDQHTATVLDRADTLICLVFLYDFARSFVTAPDRLAYMLGWGWVDLVSSIPAVDVLRWGRLARVFRILRVLRGVRAVHVLSTWVLSRRAATAFWATMFVAILVIVSGSIAILIFENGPGSNIRRADDALWWAFVTVTTVGYGDHYPVTGPGRVLAVVLMVTGIALFGTFTAYVASAFAKREGSDQEHEIAGLRQEIRALTALLEAAVARGETLDHSASDGEPRP